jgi:large subunit ribosomal protein L6
MSRIGNAIITLPAGVTVQVADDSVKVKGPKGELIQARVACIQFELSDNILKLTRDNETKQVRANHGLMRALVANMVHGVSQGYQKDLEIRGVGYRAAVKGSNLEMNLGYSHPIVFAIPKGIQIKVDKNTNISVTGIDKQQVGQVAANIRDYRKPDHYKGKGVRYVGEYVRLKAGKTA